MSRLVMLVDDDVDFREAMTAVLRIERYAVIAPVNGIEALRHLESGAELPALIVLDLMQPVMDGWQFVREQRSRPVIADIPVVLISGEHDLARHAAELGVAGYLEKPVGVDPLLALIRRFAEP